MVRETGNGPNRRGSPVGRKQGGGREPRAGKALEGDNPCHGSRLLTGIVLERARGRSRSRPTPGLEPPGRRAVRGCRRWPHPATDSDSRCRRQWRPLLGGSSPGTDQTRHPSPLDNDVRASSLDLFLQRDPGASAWIVDPAPSKVRVPAHGRDHWTVREPARSCSWGVAPAIDLSRPIWTMWHIFTTICCGGNPKTTTFGRSFTTLAISCKQLSQVHRISWLPSVQHTM